jgi:hypothetical protein
MAHSLPVSAERSSGAEFLLTVRPRASAGKVTDGGLILARQNHVETNVDAACDLAFASADNKLESPLQHIRRRLGPQLEILLSDYTAADYSTSPSSAAIGSGHVMTRTIFITNLAK